MGGLERVHKRAGKLLSRLACEALTPDERPRERGERCGLHDGRDRHRRRLVLLFLFVWTLEERVWGTGEWQPRRPAHIAWEIM